MSVVELTTFTVRAERTPEMLAARAGMLEAFRRDRRGFRSARLVRVAENTWLDFVEWDDDAAWDESKAKGANQPEIAAFFGTIDALVSSERGVRYDDEPGRVRTIAYGPAPSQVGELYLPGGDGPFPVVVLLHGGYRDAGSDRRQMTALADDLVAHGYAVWNVGYRQVGEEGAGRPGTFEDVAAAVDAVADLDPVLDVTRVVAIGHSAGGGLATWAAARTELPEGAPGADPRVPLAGAFTHGDPLDFEAADGHLDVLDPAEQAWKVIRDGVDRRFAGLTVYELPPVDVNAVLAERYDLAREYRFTRTSLWDMEIRKASAPDKYLPNVVRPGSLAKFGEGADFVRVSDQKHWLDPSRYGTVIERVHLDHRNQRALFYGLAEFGELRAGTGQPLFHVEHSVTGTEDRPINRWRIVFLTETPDPALTELFAAMAEQEYLPEFIEVYLREEVGLEPRRRTPAR
ncbi:alpha/beta hydrolase [Amycolatopsis sp. YIM 10]|uniref:alpha/beta hydrolase n=1 Tax=Amycolatopsis sp. YIM 10 TaxID=2653857 RepID=UPI0012904302|nr:alpha/beta hydrolase [Amycolatopsis sp. YIM 10]QFU89172.1 Alpha/beta hydrolase family protein [Amycolatopsis sp. YIM 10]